MIQGLIQTNHVKLTKPDGVIMLHSIATPSEQKLENLVQAYHLLEKSVINIFIDTLERAQNQMKFQSDNSQAIQFQLITV